MNSKKVLMKSYTKDSDEHRTEGLTAMRKKQKGFLSSFSYLPLVVFCLSCSAAPSSGPPLLPPGSASPSPALAQVNQLIAAAAAQGPPAAADYRIGPEDMVRITLFNIPEGEGRVTPRTVEIRVSQQGVITLPLLGEVTVAGLTATELEQVLRQRYDRYMRDPQVGVFIVDYRSQRVAVMGAVRNPGVFQLSGPKTLLDVLAMANGVADNAGRQIHLRRQSQGQREDYIIDLDNFTRNPEANIEALNMLVQGGDLVNVSLAGSFFVDGAVFRAGSFVLDRPYTLTKALATAGGVNFELAKTSAITIFRRQGTTMEPILVNLDEIKAGKAIDPPIEAEDVVSVPVSAAKYFVKRFVGVIVTGSTFLP